MSQFRNIARFGWGVLPDKRPNFPIVRWCRFLADGEWNLKRPAALAPIGPVESESAAPSLRNRFQQGAVFPVQLAYPLCLPPAIVTDASGFDRLFAWMPLILAYGFSLAVWRRCTQLRNRVLCLPTLYTIRGFGLSTVPFGPAIYCAL